MADSSESLFHGPLSAAESSSGASAESVEAGPAVDAALRLRGYGGDLVPLQNTARWGSWTTEAGISTLVVTDIVGNVHLRSGRGEAWANFRSPGAAIIWSTWVRLDGVRFLATVGTGGIVRLWDLGPPTVSRSGSATTRDHAFNLGEDVLWAEGTDADDAPWIATGDQKGNVKAWRIRSGSSGGPILEEFELVATSRSTVAETSTGSSASLSAAPALWGAWGRIGDELVLATGDQNGVVQLWDKASGLQRRDPSTTHINFQRFDRGSSVEWGVWCYHENDPIIATGVDGAIRFWNVRTGVVRAVVLLASAAIRWARFIRLDDRPLMVTGSDDGLVRFWDPMDGSQCGVGNTGPPEALTWGALTSLDNLPILATGTERGSIRLWEIYTEKSVRRRPPYRSDDIEGTDRLGRVAEATALAELITSRSARPPLAVGLFGEWGEGKSHFVRLLAEQVAVSARRRDAFSHRHVRQIRFNAWHYAETDLWASLVAEIFGQLVQAKEVQIADGQRQQSRLVAEIIAERQLPERIAAERARGDALRAALGTKPGAAQSLSEEKRRELGRALGQFDADLAREVYRSFTTVTGQLRLRRVQIVEVWRALPKWALVFTVLSIAAVVLLLVYVPTLPASVLATLVAVVAFMGPVRAQIPAVKSTIDTIGKVRESASRVVDKWRQETQTALEVSEAAAAGLERELQNFTAAGQLAGVVSDRLTEGGYRQTLGLMTQIREDFEHMSTLLMRDHVEHLAQPHHDVEQPDAGGDSLPRIDRIVLYIDDLDRCPPARVVELLEAVHLLLAIPLFVVVVAVDPRWLVRAISVHYSDVLSAGTGSTPSAFTGSVADAEDAANWSSTPAQYLEKIFQVVFTLPPLTTEGYVGLLDDLVGQRADEPPGAAAEPAMPAVAGVNRDAETATAATESPSERDRSEPNPVADTTVDLPSAQVDERIDPLALDNDELALMRLLGPPLVTTPRSVKRLANSYGLLSATRRLREEESTVTDRAPGMILLAALVGFPALGPALLTHLYRTAQHTPEQSWHEFVNGLTPVRMDDTAHWSNRADAELAHVEAQAWRNLANALINVGATTSAASISLPEPISAWAAWVVDTGRLSFPAGRVVARLHHRQL